MKIRKYKKAFTLVELIVVIAIVAVLASVAAVSYIAFITTANESSDIQKVEALNKLIKNNEVLNEYEILNKDDLFKTFHNHDVTEENLKNNRSDSSLYFSLNLQEVIYYVGTEIKFPANLEDFSVNTGDFYFNSTEYRGYVEVNYPEESTSSGGVQISDPIAPPPSESSSEQPITDDGTTWDVSYEIPDPLDPGEYDPNFVHESDILGVEPEVQDLENRVLYINSISEFVYVFNKGSWTHHDKFDKVVLNVDINMAGLEAYLALDDHTDKTLTTIKSIPFEFDGGNHTIRNLINPKGSLISYVRYKYDVIVKNVTFDNCLFGGEESQNHAGIVGILNNENAATNYNHSITFINTTIIRCNFISKNMAVGPFIGYVVGRADISINNTNECLGVKCISPICRASKIIGLLDTNSESTEIDIAIGVGAFAILVEPQGIEHYQYSDYNLKDGANSTRNYSDYLSNDKHSIKIVNEQKYLYIRDALFHILDRNKFTLREGETVKTFNFDTGSSAPTLKKPGQANVPLFVNSLAVNRSMFEGWDSQTNFNYFNKYFYPL